MAQERQAEDGPEEPVKEWEKCRHLLAAVIRRAIADSGGKGPIIIEDVAEHHGIEVNDLYDRAIQPSNKRLKKGIYERLKESYRQHLISDSLRWIYSDANEVCSFRWICSELDLDPAAVRESLARRKEQPKSHPLVGLEIAAT